MIRPGGHTVIADPGLLQELEALARFVSVWIGWTGDRDPILAVDAERPMPSASTIKTVIAISAAKHLDWGHHVKRGTLGKTMYPSVLEAFEAERLLSVAEVVAFSLITSDNPCANYLFEELGSARIRATIDELGLVCTRADAGFEDVSLDDGGRANVTSAADLATVFRHLEQSRKSDERVDRIWTWLTNNQRNNRISALLPDGLPVAHKTGSLPGVVNDAGVVALNGSPLTIVTLLDGSADPIASSAGIARFAVKVCEGLTGGEL